MAGQYATNGTTLAGAAKQWPTPGAMDGHRAGKAETYEGFLEHRAKHAGRGVNAHFHMNAASSKWSNGRLDLTPTGKRSPNTSGLRLNPRFVEWLMGFPDEWTVSAPSATPSSPSKPRTHSGDS